MNDIEKARELYLEAFPPEERRPWSDIEHPASPLGPQLHILHDAGGEFAGFMTLWNFGTFVYLEHFAISPHKRGSGIGSRALEALVAQCGNSPLVLEVERPAYAPDAAAAERRIDFYRRAGFDIVDRQYIQPPYAPGLPKVPLYIMASAKIDVPHAVERIKKTVYLVKN